MQLAELKMATGDLEVVLLEARKIKSNFKVTLTRGSRGVDAVRRLVLPGAFEVHDVDVSSREESSQRFWRKPCTSSFSDSLDLHRVPVSNPRRASVKEFKQ